MNKIISQVAFGVLIISLVLTGCAPAVSTPVGPTPTSAPIKIKAGVPLNLSNGAFFIAQEEGFFAEQGLDVEFVTLASSSRAVPLLISGDLDMLAGQISVAHFNAMQHDTHVRIVADKGSFEPGACASASLLVSPDFLKTHPLNGPADLKGLRVNLASPTGFSGYQMTEFLARGNLTFADVQLQNLDSAAELAAFEQGLVDVVYLAEPALTKEVLAGKAVVWQTADQLVADKQIAFVVYGPTLIDKNLEAGQRFMVAYLKAVRQYNQGKTDRNLDIIAKYTQLDRALLGQACWQFIRNDGHIDIPSLVHFQAWAVKNKSLEAAIPPEVFWDQRFIDYANQVLSSGK